MTANTIATETLNRESIERLDRAIRKYHPQLEGKRAYAGEILNDFQRDISGMTDTELWHLVCKIKTIPLHETGQLMDFLRPYVNSPKRKSAAEIPTIDDKTLLAAIIAAYDEGRHRNDDAALAEFKRRISMQEFGNRLLPMNTAPKDGSRILLWIEHENLKYSSANDRHQWEGWCIGSWTSFNKGGWTWYGLCGVKKGWLPLPKIEDGGANG